VLIGLARAAPEAAGSALQRLRTAAPLPGAAAAITSDGLERALEIREALDLPPDAPLTGDFDLEAVLLPRLGIRIEQVHLDDVDVDGIAIAEPNRTAVIAINKSSPRADTRWGRRMTLAHELCHLLFDVDDEGRVGLVSNPWADAAMERRANAFAVMLLAPEAAIRTTLDRASSGWTRTDLEVAMAHLGVGLTALTRQLENLGWIDASARESWLDTFSNR
jgi:Zn-dependent peptidase ImmA (M78 family)